jgi:hypothetical protein
MKQYNKLPYNWMLNLDSALHSCLYRILQCEGKEMQIYIYLCDMISLSVIKCVVYKALKLWLWVEEIIFCALEQE